MEKKITILYHRLDYCFKDEELVLRALTHVSVSRKKSYERLEFLGDRILGAVIAEMLYRYFPQDPEGALAKRFARLVNARTLETVALELGLPDFIILAPWEQASGGARKPSILGDVCEALLAALYLDGGLRVVSQIIHRYWEPFLKTMERPPLDAKSALQEHSQSLGKGVPIYTSLRAEGPDHAPVFTVQAMLEGYPAQQGQGTTKRIAEQNAAAALLTLMKGSVL